LFHREFMLIFFVRWFDWFYEFFFEEEGGEKKEEITISKFLLEVKILWGFLSPTKREKKNKYVFFFGYKRKKRDVRICFFIISSHNFTVKEIETKKKLYIDIYMYILDSLW